MKKYKMVFLVFCLFVFHTAAQTDCERSKLALGKTKKAWEKNKVEGLKIWETYIKLQSAYRNNYHTWKKALKTWIETNDSVAKAAWQKADKAYKKSHSAWERSEVAAAKARVLLSETIFQEAKKQKTKVIKSCKVDSSQTKLIFPSWTANPESDPTIIPFIPINAIASKKPKKKISDKKGSTK